MKCSEPYVENETKTQPNSFPLLYDNGNVFNHAGLVLLQYFYFKKCAIPAKTVPVLKTFAASRGGLHTDTPSLLVFTTHELRRYELMPTVNLAKKYFSFRALLLSPPLINTNEMTYRSGSSCSKSSHADADESSVN